MKLFITGATGFIGTHLVRHLLAQGHHVAGTGRREPAGGARRPDFRFVAADTTRPGPWQETLAASDAVINLAGESIYGRWTQKRKQAMADSRVLTTRNVVAALGERATLVSVSGVGYYGNRGDDLISESEPAGRGAIVALAADWEAEALRAAARGRRVVVARLGVVLGPGGGALAQMIPAFKGFLGGPIGDGRQWFSWIHIEDLLAAFDFVLARPEMAGAVNFTSPNPVRNRELAAALGKALHRPAVMPAPAFAIRLALGEFAQVLLESQRVVPAKLLDRGFRFRFGEIDRALASLVADPAPAEAPKTGGDGPAA
jgi:uncharacterized protein (TIGR01777 family)